MMDLNNVDLSTKRYLFANYFSSGTNSENSFGIKIEVLMLLCFLTQELCKRCPDDYKNTYDVLTKFVYNNTVMEPCGWTSYIEALSVVCDDLMFGCESIPKPTKYSSASEVKNRIKEIIAEWLPF